MRKVGAKSLPNWVVILIIALVLIGVLAFFELSYGFLFGDDGIFKPASEKKLSEFSSAVFDDLSVRADGREHSVRVRSIPLGATVEYDIGNTFTAAGTYVITATISMDGYKTKTMTATLTLYEAYIITFRQHTGQREFEVKKGETFDMNLVPTLDEVSGWTAVWEEFDPKLTGNLVVKAIYTRVEE